MTLLNRPHPPLKIILGLSLWGILFASFTSCSLSSVITVHKDNSADVAVTVAWKKPLSAYWSDLRELDASLPPQPLEADAVRSALDKASNLDASPLQNPQVQEGQRSVNLSFHWSATPKTNVWGLELTPTSTGDTLSLTWNRQTLERWLNTTTYARSEALSALLPDSKTTQVQLANNLAYALGSYSDNAQALVEGSVVQLVFNLPRPVKSLEGNASYQGKVVTCRWPLTDFLTQSETLTVTY